MCATCVLTNSRFVAQHVCNMSTCCYMCDACHYMFLLTNSRFVMLADLAPDCLSQIAMEKLKPRLREKFASNAVAVGLVDGVLQK